MSVDRPKWASWEGASHYLREFYLRSITEDELGYRNPRASVLRDLERFIAHIPHDIHYLMDVRQWRLEALRERDPYMAKPRIELQLDITSKGNLILRWYPLGAYNHFYRGQDATKSDFSDSVATLADNLYAGQRPDNELLFVHQFRELGNELADTSEKGDVARLLAFATFAAACEWERFLHHSFEVSKGSWFDFIEINGLVIDWVLYDVQQRAAEQEREWIAGFQAQYGISPTLFLSTYAQFRGWSKHEATTKKLKELGFKMTPGTVRELTERIRDKHPALWSEASITDDAPHIVK